jgi:membrane-bound lytic murein transglycosylase F
MVQFLRILFYLLIFPFLIGCSHSRQSSDNAVDSTEWQKIKQRGTIIAATDFNSINYFIFNGRPRGFQYELLENFAKSLKMRFTIITPLDLTESFDKLEKGECDIIAQNLTTLPEREEKMYFSDPLLYTRQVLVQKKPEGYDSLPEADKEKRILSKLEDLNGKSIFVHENSSFAVTLKQIKEAFPFQFNIVEVPEKTEKLLEMVSRGDMDYTVCDELVGLAYQNTYPNLDISMPLTDFQHLSWAVRKTAPMLLDTLNKWIATFKKTNDYATIFARYFKNQYMVAISGSELYSIKSGKISNYDVLIKKYSKDIGWDWRLIASMIYLESKFQYNAESHKGAFGIMQLMPETARRYGVSEKSSSEAQIRAGIRIMKDIFDIFKSEMSDSSEQIKFTLAAYNIGIGHIRDAQVIAKKLGKSPYIWDNNVDFCLLLKSNPEYFKDPDVKFGYCIGRQTVKYVDNIMDLYDHYKNVVPE